MPKKTIVGEYEGHRFKVENTWLSGAKLFHDDKLIAVTNDELALDKNEPKMTAKVLINRFERVVEVYFSAVFTVKIQIRVDGKKIAGDDF